MYAANRASRFKREKYTTGRKEDKSKNILGNFITTLSRENKEVLNNTTNLN